MFPYPEINWLVPLSHNKSDFIFSVPEIVPIPLNLALVPVKINAIPPVPQVPGRASLLTLHNCFITVPVRETITTNRFSNI